MVNRVEMQAHTAADVAAKWWANQIRDFAEKLGGKNKTIRTDTPSGTVEVTCFAPTTSQIECFEEKLTRLLEKRLTQYPNQVIILDTTCGLYGILEAAAELSNIDALLFPSMSNMKILPNSVRVSKGFEAYSTELI